MKTRLKTVEEVEKFFDDLQKEEEVIDLEELSIDQFFEREAEKEQKMGELYCKFING